MTPLLRCPNSPEGSVWHAEDLDVQAAPASEGSDPPAERWPPGHGRVTCQWAVGPGVGLVGRQCTAPGPEDTADPDWVVCLQEEATGSEEGEVVEALSL